MRRRVMGSISINANTNTSTNANTTATTTGLKKDGTPKHPNATPRKQPANHPFRRKIIGSKYHNDIPDDDAPPINPTSYSGHAERRADN
jgi:hypothetical protein